MGAYSTARGAAIALGCAASGGAAYVLLKEDWVSGRWSDSFVLVPLILGIAVVAGHLAAKASRDRSFLSAIGFALAFFLGTTLTVYQSVSKQATTSDARMLDTEASNQARLSVEADLSRARLRYQQALDQADRETAGGCARKCEDWKLRAREVSSQIRELEAKLQGTTSVKPVAAGAERVAKVINVLSGLEVDRVKALLVLVEPFAFSLLFELTAISAFGYGFGGSRRPARAAPQSVKTQPTPSPEPPGDKRDPAIVSWVEEYTRRHGRAPQIKDVQAAFNVARVTAYRYAKRRHGTA